MWGFSCVHPASRDPSPDQPLCRDQKLKNLSIQLLTLVTCPQLCELPLPPECQLPGPVSPAPGVIFVPGDRHPDLRWQSTSKGTHILPSQNWAIKFTISPHAASTPPLHGMDSSKAWRPSLQLFGENTAYTQPMVLYYLFFFPKNSYVYYFTEFSPVPCELSSSLEMRGHKSEVTQ